MKSILTTGEIARLTQVAPRTVSMWIVKGLLTAYRLPHPKGQGAHRITRDEFTRFVKEHGFPVSSVHLTPPQQEQDSHPS
jgi:two-component system response regulator RpaA